VPGPLASARASARRLLHRPVTVWYHPAFRLPFAGLEAAVGMDPKRADAVLTWALDTGVVRPADVHAADEAPWSWLRAIHGEEYLASLDRPETIAQIMAIDARRIATAPVLESWRRAVGGTVAAARQVVAHGGRAAVLLGGFHHAAPSRGGGFCGLNDLAVAVHQLRADGFGGRVAVIDVDAHPPDGVALCLADDPAVRIASLGVASTWDAGANVTDARVPAGTGDDGYLAALDALLAGLPPADLAFVIAGADPLRGDRLGGLACTEAGLLARDRRILAHLGHTPTVLLPAGGYTPGAWRVFAGAIGAAAGSRRPVRRGYDPVLRRSRDISRTLDPQALGGEPWITADDLAIDLHVAPTEPRLLGFYTRAGIEYALSRHGLLGALARMGFEQLDVEVDASGPHRVRVTAVVDGRRQPLIELVLSRRAIDRFTCLFVEWMTLRDPRVQFTADRPRLPGQDAPGLGLFEEVGQLLMRIAERLDLAGVMSVPAHYHVAWIARKRWVLVDPDARGRFLALQRHLAHVPLLEASALLDGPGVPVEVGEPIRWEPSPVVASRDAGLSAFLAAGDARAAAVADGLAERMLPIA
jgi:acetoin utilization deacetylase AcuC-like enzyme